MITEDGTRLYGPRRLLAETMHEYVDVQGDCWLWQRSIDADGYGRVQHQGHWRSAHRVVFEMLVGAIPDGLTIDHLCRVRACVNPDHLEPVTRLENVRRSPLIHRTHCAEGHPLSGDNVMLRSGKWTYRLCRECHRRRTREWARAARQARREGLAS